MRHLFLILALALAGHLSAWTNAGPSNPVEAHQTGSEIPQASATYSALGIITPSAATLGVTLTASSGIFIAVTGSGTVVLETAILNSEGEYIFAGSLNAPFHQHFNLHAPYVRVKNGRGDAGNLTVRYKLADAPTMSTTIAAGQGISITSSPMFVGSSQTAVSASTITAGTINLTTTVGASIDTILCYQAMGLGTGINVAISTLSTAPALGAGGLGFYNAVTMTSQICSGPYKASAGYKLFYQGVGSAAPTLVLSVDKVQ